jgi:hypothetical protein
MENRDLNRVVEYRDRNGELLAPEEVIREEDMGKPLSLSDWAESLKKRMYTKSRRVV